MKSTNRQEVTMFAFAMATGTLVTLSLLYSIILLADFRLPMTKKSPLFVVDLVTVTTQKRLRHVTNEAKQREDAKPKQPIPASKKILPPRAPKPLPIAKKVIKEKLPEIIEPDQVDLRQEELTPTPASAKELPKNRLPIPVPLFRLTQVPRFLHKETPVYPETMRLNGISGEVKLVALIDKEGRVREVTILDSAGKQFDAAAKQAIFSSSFYPAKIDSEPVAVLLRIPVRFGLL